ncbi:MAG: hypothetical protein AAF196_09545 [Planctomycetota bacterium]
MLRLALPIALLGLSACVTEIYVEEPIDPDPVETQPIVIERQPAEVTSDPRYLEFQGALAQLQQAYADRDIQEMRRVLSIHRGKPNPEWAQRSFDRFESLIPAVLLELQFENSGQVLMQTEMPIAGAETDFLIVVPQVPSSNLVLPKGLDHCRFSVEASVTDISAFGERSTQRTSAVVGVPEDTPISSEGLELPFRLAAIPGAAAKREITLSVELLPGDARSGDSFVPLRRTKLAADQFTAWPDGTEAIRKAPKKHFDVFLRRRQKSTARTVYVAAHFLEGQEKKEAVDEMLRLLRIMSLDDADFLRFTTATLEVLTGAGLPLNDRDAWLNWGDRNR